MKEKDLCKTCSHFWEDFPIPLDRFIAHCDIVDKEKGFKKLDDVVPYPCLECPFNSYSPKQKDND